METAHDRWKTSEPREMGPTSEWEEARTKLTKAEEKLGWVPLKYTTRWRGMGIKANQRWERYERRIERIAEYYKRILDADTCAGCGEYSEGGVLHGNRCRAEYNAGLVW